MPPMVRLLPAAFAMASVIPFALLVMVHVGGMWSRCDVVCVKVEVRLSVANVMVKDGFRLSI